MYRETAAMLAVRLPASSFLIQHDVLHFSFEWLTGSDFY